MASEDVATAVEELLADYPASVLTVEAKAVEHLTREQRAVVDAAVRLDAAAYGGLSRRLAALLEREAAILGQEPLELTARHSQERGGPEFAFDSSPAETAAFLTQLGDKKTPSRQAVTPEAAVVLTGRLPGELRGAVYPVGPEVGAALAAAIDRATAARLRVRLLDAAGEELTAETGRLVAPFDGTQDGLRFLQPLAPLGYAWALEKGHFSPFSSMREWHRKNGPARRVVGLLPGLVLPAVRGEDADETVVFGDAVTVRASVPVAGKPATAVAELLN